MNDLNVSEKTEKIRSGDSAEVKKILKNCLTNDEEQILIDRGDDKLFRFYIRRHGLSFSSQLYLMKCPSPELIRSYICWYSLVWEAQLILIERNDKKLVRSYAHYRFFSSTDEIKQALRAFVKENPQFQNLIENY